MLSDQVKCPIAGVRLRTLEMHRDGRGCFAEVFRACWDCVPKPIQWAVVNSGANVLRGVHVHVKHFDYLLAAAGRMLVGLSDLRQESPTYKFGCLLDLDDSSLTAVEIPPGVAHGFYFPCANLMLHGASEYYDPADELACHWNDPALNIPWPPLMPKLSERDQNAGSVAEAQALRQRVIGKTNAQRIAA